MKPIIKLFSKKDGDLNKFLSSFYNIDLQIDDRLNWEKEYANPIEIADMVGIYADNSDKYDISMWICIDKNILIKISSNNANQIIKYLFERFPY